jgi:hypothetical protein
MAGAQEALTAKNPMAADLAAGVEALSRVQEITFTRYIRLVLPLDGFVFWVNASIVSRSALVNAALVNKVEPNQSPETVVGAPTFNAKGSMHYATDLRQEAGEYYGAERMVFTAEEPVNDLSAIAPGTLWIGEFEGKKFAFSSRSSFYMQADLFHYIGFAVYPDMLPQLIDDPSGFDSTNVIVSNSLPAWLALNGRNPVYGFNTLGITLFPSFLSPQNERPPFGTVDIPPESTRALASAPTIDPATSTHTQLCAETVKITLWGTRNFNALDFLDAIYQYSSDFEAFGIMNIPTVRDEKRTQAELGTIAMKKSIEFEISYLQNRMNDIAVKLITSAVPSFYIGKA